MAAPDGGSTSPVGATGNRRVLNLVTGTCVFLVLVWLAARLDDLTLSYSFTGQKKDYYNLLVDGFLKGQLHMDAEVHPGLLSEDWDVRIASPFLLDANLYQGRYYLYYGVVPAALLMLPYSALTGHDLDPNLVVLFFLALGLAAAVRVFEEVRRTHFAALPRPLHVIFIVLLGLGSGIPFLATRSMFYETPVAAGYACSMVAVWALWRALQQPLRPVRPLILASIALSLAVGCRPNYSLTLPVLLLPALLAWRARDTRPLGAPSVRTLLAAVLLPSITIGAGLAWYNFARFGNPLEFGFKYGMNTFFWTGFPFASERFIWPNLKWYYFTPPAFSPYFPFFYPIAASFRPEGYYGDEAMHGHFASTVLLLLVVAGLIARPLARQRLRALRPWFAILGWMTVTSLAFMLILTIRGNRYSVDFHAPLVLMLACTAAVLVSSPGRLRLLFRAIIGAAAVVTAFVGLGSSIQQFDDFRNMRPETYARLSRVLNQPSAWAARLGLMEYGPVTFDVVFPEVDEAKVEPLLVAGTPYYSDGLFVAQHPGNNIQFQLDHHGYGGPSSALIPIEPGRTYRIELLMGALFPPKVHPYFQGIPAHGVHQLKEFAQVHFDGEMVIEGKLASYDAPPWSLTAGENFITHKPFAPTFSGEIGDVRRADFTPPLNPAHAQARSGILQLMVKFPLEKAGAREPLVASGHTGAGNLLLVEIIDESHVRFSIDFWAFGLVSSDPIAVENETAHRIGVFIGPLAQEHDWPPEAAADPAALAAQARTLRVWLNGEPIWTVALAHHLDSFRSLDIGANPQGFSTAHSLYSQTIYIAPQAGDDEWEFLRLNLALPPAP